MRLGISALFQASGGSLTNLVQLLRAWHDSAVLARHEVTLFTSARVAARINQASPDALVEVTVVYFPASDRGLAGRFLDEQFRLPREVRSRRIEVLFCPGGIAPFWTAVPVVPTFQNAGPFCDSMSPANLGLLRWFQVRALRLGLQWSARKAAAAIFLSEWSRELFAREVRFPLNAGTVIRRAGADPATPDPHLEERYGIRRPYVLSVSHLNPYKQTVEMLEGFALSSRDVPGRQLVLVGMAQFRRYYARILETIERLGLSEKVVLTGEVPHGDAIRLMAGCESFFFTSVCETGPTVLMEALSLGLPVGASAAGPMREVLGDAALWFDARDPTSIANALRRLMGDGLLRRELRERAARRWRELPDGAEIAAATIAILENARVRSRTTQGTLGS